MIETPRLRLDALNVAAADAIVAGDRGGRPWHAEFPRRDDQDAATMVLRRWDPIFGSFAIVEKMSDLVVGTIGFFGPPEDDGCVMIGYGLVSAARGRGYATEALQALIQYAFAQQSVRTVRADPLIGNVASHRVLEKAGFQRTHSTGDAQWYAIGRTTV